MICSGATWLPRSSPAIIASAITPEPTVAIVASRSAMAASLSAHDGTPEEEEAARGRHLDLGEADRAQGVLQLARLVIDLDDLELAAVLELARLELVDDRRVVGLARLVDE